MPRIPRPHAFLRLLLVLPLVCGSGLVGCGGDAGAEEPGDRKGKGKGKGDRKGKGRGKGKGKWGGGEEEPQGPLAVTVINVAPAPVYRYYRTSGTLKALRTADIVAIQSGVIEKLQAEEGDVVESGQLLAKLDARSFQLQASRDQITAQNAKKQLSRLEQIAAQDAVAREELDQQLFSLKTAQASAKLSRHQVRQSEIRAPFTGTITQRHVDVGNLAGPSTPLFSLADLSALDLELHLPEAEAATVKIGSEVDIELLDESVFQAKILRRAPIVDPLTGTVKFTVRSTVFPDIAVPGAFARAKVLVDTRKAAPSLPHSALFDVEGKTHVYVVEDGKASRRRVEVGLMGEDRVEINGGLEPDAQVVLDSSSGITEGLPVKAVAESASHPEHANAANSESETQAGSGSDPSPADSEAQPADTKASEKRRKPKGRRGQRP